MADLLNVEHLSVSFFTPAGEVQAVRDVSFSLKAGEVLAIVGESGCGKSVLCKSILRLLPQTAKIKSGKIIVDGTDITAYREREMTALRGSLFSMVFQDPMTALDPTMTIGVQIAEAVLAHKPKLEKSAVRARVIELLELVGIDRAQERMALYPPQLFRWDAPARGAGHRACGESAHFICRRADDRAGCDHSSADLRSAARRAAKARHGGGVCHARPRRRRARRRPRGRDVRGQDRRDWHGGGDLLRPAPPLYVGAAALAARALARKGDAAEHPRHTADAHRPAARRRLCQPQ